MKLLLLLLALLVGAQAQCLSTDNACLAFEWAFPLWTTANARWNQAAGWAPAPLYPAGFLSGTPSLFFHMNTLSIRRASLPPPAIPPMALCDAFLCEGTPHILNPGPIITPNVDTTYGAAWLDLAQPQVLIIPNAGPNVPYYSITFFDMYLNTKTTLSNVNYPAGGVWCIVASPAQQPACTAAIPQIQAKIPTFTAYTDTLTLPRFGVAIARIYSSGAPDFTNLNACGPDGCTFASNIAFTALTTTPPTIDPYTLYGSMASPLGCPYVYGQKPCGNAATPAQRNKFWDTVCQVLHDGPPSSPAEQGYIQTMFSGFGITPTGCSNLDYASLNAAFDAGYASLLAAQSTFGVASNHWLYFPTTGTWDASTFHTRAVSSFRLHFLVDNTQAGYWAAFTTADGVTRLNGAANAEYTVNFDQNIPIDTGHKGFWSVTLYDPSWFLYTNPANVYAIRGNTALSAATVGSWTISHACGARPRCLPAPAGPFQLLLREYLPTDAANPTQAYVSVSLGSNFCPADVSAEANTPVTFTIPPSSTCDHQPGVFAPGITKVKCTSTVSTAYCSFLVSVQEPFLTCPPSTITEATSKSGTVVTWPAPVVHDNADPNLIGASVTCRNGLVTVVSGVATFPVGVSTITCSATDVNHFTGGCQFTITVQDTTIPTVSPACPTQQLPLVILEATGPTGAVGMFDGSATDVVDGPLFYGCKPGNATMFALGTTAVQCGAIDTHLNQNGCGFSVVVCDTTAPVLTCPPAVGPLEATGPGGATATFTPTALDIVDGSTPVTCTPASGSTFVVGDTLVQCQSLDSHKNMGVCSFHVTVRDTTAPSITCPADITAEATGSNGASVTFSGSAHDIHDGDVAVTCSPASGSTFALGSHAVTCSASDAAGNINSCLFTVTVADTTVPTITCPANIQTPAISSSGAPVSFTASANDIVDGAFTPICTPASGSTFAIGFTTVTCSATDAHGNGPVTCSFSVTITEKGHSCSGGNGGGNNGNNGNGGNGCTNGNNGSGGGSGAGAKNSKHHDKMTLTVSGNLPSENVEPLRAAIATDAGAAEADFSIESVTEEDGFTVVTFDIAPDPAAGLTADDLSDAIIAAASRDDSAISAYEPVTIRVAAADSPASKTKPMSTVFIVAGAALGVIVLLSAYAIWRNCRKVGGPVSGTPLVKDVEAGIDLDDKTPLRGEGGFVQKMKTSLRYV